MATRHVAARQHNAAFTDADEGLPGRLLFHFEVIPVSPGQLVASLGSCFYAGRFFLVRIIFIS